ncbi:hypothetical protein IWQ51_005780 [Labrenzia sp. EL_142]|nr:hypothetical protein [Labrenzia sp. EL_142]
MPWSFKAVWDEIATPEFFALTHADARFRALKSMLDRAGFRQEKRSMQLIWACLRFLRLVLGPDVGTVSSQLRAL